MSRRLALIIAMVCLSLSLAVPAFGQHAATRSSPTPPPEANELKRLWNEKKSRASDQYAQAKPQPIELEEAVQAFLNKDYELATIKFRQAWSKDPDNLEIAQGLMYSQLRSIRPRPSESTSKPLVAEFATILKRFPDDPDLNVGYGMALAYAGDPVGAQQAFHRAKTFGADLERAVGRSQLDRISRLAKEKQEQQAVDENFRLGTILGAVLLGGLVLWIVVMFGTGWLLAISIPRTPETADAFATLRSSRETWIERFYLFMLSVSLIIFYLSVPFVIAGIIAVSLLLFAILLMLRVLHIGVLYRGCWAVWHMIRLVFFGSGGERDGIEITAEQQPKLFGELHSVARQLDTEVVDRVYLVPGPQVSVSQNGAGPFGLFGRRDRVLHLGISVLPWLTVNEFRSILAHEYAHFSHRDTFYARFIFQVTASLANSLAVMQAAAGILNYINPFYGLYWLYLRGYALLSSGYSRSREFLADRRAVVAYGRQPFVAGLTKIYQESPLFELFAVRKTQQLLSRDNAFLNVFDSYRDYRSQPGAVELRSKLLDEERHRKPSWFDSHPTYEERLAAVASFPLAQDPAHSVSALDLIHNFKELEESLTRMLTDHIREVLGPAEVVPSSDDDELLAGILKEESNRQ
uniref:M48 family metalloprotease n=1 Tax=Schlesneria sphaerica TaxID=3373610 RepID=UPI0037C73143